MSAGQLPATHLPVYVAWPFIVWPLPVIVMSNFPVPFSESTTWMVPCTSDVIPHSLPISHDVACTSISVPLDFNAVQVHFSSDPEAHGFVLRSFSFTQDL